MSKETGNCPLCDFSSAERYMLGVMDAYRIICPRCGEYMASWEILQFSDDQQLQGKKHILSGLARELKETKQQVLEFAFKNFEETLKHYLVPRDVDDVDEKVAKLLQRIKDKTSYYGYWCVLDYDKDWPLAYAQNSREFVALLRLLKDAGFVRIKENIEKELLHNIPRFNPGGANITTMLTAEGWKKAAELKTENRGAKQGFVAIWFDPEKSMDASIAAIEEGISNAGFRPLCIKDEHFAERIMDKALGEIRRSRFVVVDLTGSRPSVFFEAGFANGLNVEAVYVYREGEEAKNQSLEFYTKHYKCYPYKDAAELREIVRDVIRARYSA